MISRRKAIFSIVFSVLGIILGMSLFKRRQYLKNRQSSVVKFKGLIDDIAEKLIPRTSTPGAKEVNVSQYIINVIENCTSSRDKRNFITGLKEVDSYSLSNYSSDFSGCEDSAKNTILRHFESKGSFSNPFLNKIKRKIVGESFFEQMKWLTVSGYCQSQLGATQGLAYDHIPVDFLSCIPYVQGQRSWATK